MDVSHLQNEISIDALSKWLDMRTDVGKTALAAKLSSWKTDADRLKALSYQYYSVKSTLHSNPELIEYLQNLFIEVSELESNIGTIAKPISDLERESYGELLFLKPVFSPLNAFPLILSVWSIMRVYVLPGLSILLPLCMLIVPFFIIRYMFGLPLTMERYMSLIISLLSGNTSITDIDKAPNIWSSMASSPMQALVKLGGAAVTVAQSIIQPYWNYKHLHAIKQNISSEGGNLVKLRELYKSAKSVLDAHGLELPRCPIPDVHTPESLLAAFLTDSIPFHLALRYLGKLEALFRVANSPHMAPVNWVTSDTPIFKVRDTFDFRVTSNSTPFSINLSNKDTMHSLLTGPNRGGKSTVLRGIVTSALLAHTYGCAIGTEAILSPLTYIFVCLKPDDLPGTKSRFEREVEFTARTLQPSAPTLVLIDELFHSTNAPDALKSCKIYCNELWNKRTHISIISTHLFELVEDSDKNRVGAICCPAHIDSSGKINFSYKLQPGICKVSSVYDLLRQYGFSIPSALGYEDKNSNNRQE